MGKLIGITSDRMSVSEKRRGRHDIVYIKKAVADAVIVAGGLPVILPFSPKLVAAKKTMASLDGLIISGGNFDISPSLFGEKPHKKLGTTERQRTLYELALLKAAIDAGKPVLGICGGHQLINVHFGGTLYQDIRSQTAGAKDHEQKSDPRKTSHTVTIEKGSRLSAIVRRNSLRVNSTHHQAVKKLGRGLKASGCSEDGIVEAVESVNKNYLLGVQWHPEFLCRMEPQLKLFKSFIKACAAR